jgi:dTDP-4-dehydrorhamnose reductase
MYKQKILVTGGDGRFANVLKEKNKKLNLYFASKKECNILSLNSLTKIIKKN